MPVLERNQGGKGTDAGFFFSYKGNSNKRYSNPEKSSHPSNVESLTLTEKNNWKRYSVAIKYHLILFQYKETMSTNRLYFKNESIYHSIFSDSVT